MLLMQTSVQPSKFPYILNGKRSMGEIDEFDRLKVHTEEEYRVDGVRNGSLREDSAHADANGSLNGRDSQGRTTGSPLPMGAAGRPLSGRSEVQGGRANVPPPGRSLSAPAPAENEASAGMQWFTGVMKQAVPFVQKLLPLLDGQIATAVANLLTMRPHVPPAPRVDLQPIENSLAGLQLQQSGLKDQLVEHNTALKRVEDHLELVREATDRNTLEQQELIEDLKAITGRINLFALLFLGLLVISVLLNIFLFLHIQRVLP